MHDKNAEYEMLRAEILQDLQNYQNVRNMMYLITSTILGFALGSETKSSYLFLLPLIVILPSFLVSVDYLRGVTKISAYLQVFHESSTDSVYHWERRQDRWATDYGYHKLVNLQHFPYIICAIACIILYFIAIFPELNDKDFLIGIIVFVGCICIYIKYQRVDREGYVKSFSKLKMSERI